MIGVVLKFVSVVCFSEVSCFRFVVSNPEGGGVDNSRCGGYFFSFLLHRSSTIHTQPGFASGLMHKHHAGLKSYRLSKSKDRSSATTRTV